MQAALSVLAAIAPFRRPGTLTKRARPPVFPPSEGGGEPGADGTDHPNLTSRLGTGAERRPSWPDGGISRLHRIGGRRDEGIAGLKPFTLRPGIQGTSMGCRSRLSRSSPLEAGFEGSRTAA
ncbi:hypothetical protein ACMDCR_08015 [Labrys okinawensis]|uniref:hypothetical protein n=1 Tax=Labrys okinawensis TaxID=346911 RepID=UPI0039BD1C84